MHPTPTVAHPQEFCIFTEHKERTTQNTPQVIYLICNSQGRCFEILALLARGLSSVNALGRIHVIQLQCLQSKHTTENLENELRPDSPDATESSVGGWGERETSALRSASQFSDQSLDTQVKISTSLSLTCVT